MGQDNGGFALSGFAGGSADALQEILKQKFIEMQATREFQLRQQQLEQDAARDAEGRRQWAADHGLRQSAQKRLDDAARAETDERTNRRLVLQGFIKDPASLSAMPPAQRLLTLGLHGVQNVGIHDLESADEHRAHTTADREAEFSDWRRRQDYDEQQLRSRPQRPLRGTLRLAPGQDDPALPFGSQRYALEIARKHGGNFESAQAEALAYTSDPQTQRDHPGLSPQKFMDAVRRAMSRPSGGNSLTNGLPAAPPADPQSALVVRSGRGGGPGGTLYRWNDGSTRAYPEPSQSAASPSPGAKLGIVKLRAPDGSELELPEGSPEIDHYVKRGAKVVK